MIGEQINMAPIHTFNNFLYIRIKNETIYCDKVVIYDSRIIHLLSGDRVIYVHKNEKPFDISFVDIGCRKHYYIEDIKMYIRTYEEDYTIKQKYKVGTSVFSKIRNRDVKGEFSDSTMVFYIMMGWVKEGMILDKLRCKEELRSEIIKVLPNHIYKLRNARGDEYFATSEEFEICSDVYKSVKMMKEMQNKR
jgi:hypothetical protein